MCCATCQKATFDFAVPAASTWKEIRRCGVRPASRVPLFTSRSNHFDSSPHRCTWPQSRHRFLMSQTSQGVVNVCVKLNQIYLLIYLGFAFSIILTSSLYVAAISPSTLNIAQVTCTGPADERPPPRRRCAGTSFRIRMKRRRGDQIDLLVVDLFVIESPPGSLPSGRRRSGAKRHRLPHLGSGK